MTIQRVKEAARLRGMKFDGVKTWRNSIVGVAYEIDSPSGRDFMQADTLDGIYRYVMRFEKPRRVTQKGCVS